MSEPTYRPITAGNLDKLQAMLRAREDHLLKAKGHDYTRGQADRLANFHETAKDLNLTPEQVWAVHFHKQVCAVMTWAATGQLESEALSERFVDIRNYCLLGMALHKASQPVRAQGCGEPFVDPLDPEMEGPKRTYPYP